jgi:hypothetical protein
MERKLHDSDGMVVDAIFQWLQHFGSSKVWKVFTRHYKVHGKDMGSPSYFPNVVQTIITPNVLGLLISQMKLKCCNDFQIVIDIIDDIDDNDVVVIPKPFVFTCLAKDHVPPIKNPLVLPTPTYERPTFFLAHPFSIS